MRYYSTLFLDDNATITFTRPRTFGNRNELDVLKRAFRKYGVSLIDVVYGNGPVDTTKKAICVESEAIC